MARQDVEKKAKPATAMSLRGVGAAAIGAVFGAAAIGLAFGQAGPAARVTPPDGTSALFILPQAQLEDALQTVDPEQRPALEKDFKACKLLPTQMRISKIPGSVEPASGLLQIRAGSYLSPIYKVGDFPVSVLVPTPAAGDVGRGQVEYLGTAANVRLELDPPVDVINLVGSKTVNVIWNTVQPCPTAKE